MTRTPIIRLAVHFDSASEISEPPKPKTAANTNRPPRPPCGNRTPKTLLEDENDHAEQDQHGEVGHDEQENAFHKPFLCENQPQYGNAAGPSSGRCHSISRTLPCVRLHGLRLAATAERTVPAMYL